MPNQRGRPIWLYAAWYGEISSALAAVWSWRHGAGVAEFWPVAAYLLVCGLALAVPGRLLRAAVAGLPARHRRALAHLYLIVACGLTAAALSTLHLAWAVVAACLTANAVWSAALHHEGVDRAAPHHDDADQRLRWMYDAVLRRLRAVDVRRRPRP